MQIKRQDAIGAGDGQNVRNQLGGDRHPADILAILAGVAIVRQHRGNPFGAGTLEAVEHDQQLHQVLVHRRACRLDDKDIPAANVFLDAHRDFAVRKVRQGRLAQWIAKYGGNLFRQAEIGPATEHFELVIAVHGPGSPLVR